MVVPTRLFQAQEAETWVSGEAERLELQQLGRAEIWLDVTLVWEVVELWAMGQCMPPAPPGPYWLSRKFGKVRATWDLWRMNTRFLLSTGGQ